MTKLTNVLSTLATFAIGGLIFASCSSSTTAPTGGVTTGVSVTGVTASSITVTWTRDASDNGTDTLFVMTSSGANAGNSPVTVANGATGNVTGLTVSTPYTIIVASANGRSSSINYTIPAPATGLMVLSMNSTTIAAEWTRSAGDTWPDTIVAMNGGTVAGQTIIMSGSSGAVTGLTDGTVYTISVHGATGVSNSMMWAPGDRTSTIQIYETADPSAGDPSALILGSNSTASSLSGLANADFVLESITDGSVPSGISLVSGQVHNSAWNATRVESSSPDHPDYIVGGLNEDYDSTNYQADQAASTANSYDIPNDASYGTKGSRVLITTTANGNLALVEIVPDVSGTLYSTSGGYKYITVNVSYQNTPNEPYAARGRSTHSSGPVKRISAR